MPKTKINYTNTVIYKIVHKEDFDNENIYIGSTTDFIKRKYNHKRCCNNETYKEFNQKKYKFIRENGGWEMWDMIEIEKYPCNDNQEAFGRERYWYEYFNAKLNDKFPSRSKKEYAEINTEKTKEYQKSWYEQNKEIQLLKHTNYRNEHKEQNAQVQKEWRYKNQEYRKNQQKEYRELNKEKIKQNKTEKILCDCGSEICRNDLNRHKKSKKHNEYEKGIV